MLFSRSVGGRAAISSAAVGNFIAKWNGTGRAERANYIPFLSELCGVLGVPLPEPASGSGGNYRFERGVQHQEVEGSPTKRRIDLYKRGCFVLEAKQGENPKPADLFGFKTEAERRSAIRRSPRWARNMLEAKGQAEGYARDLPAEEGWPPFLIVCDVGFCFDLYADFTGTGKHYAQFPDREGFRIYLPDLARPEIQERLRAVWTDAHSLDPARQRVRVTRLPSCSRSSPVRWKRRAQCRSRNWCCGSVICNGTSALAAVRRPRSRFCAISITFASRMPLSVR